MISEALKYPSLHSNFLCSESEHKSEHSVYPLLEHFCVHLTLLRFSGVFSDPGGCKSFHCREVCEGLGSEKTPENH